VDLECGTTSATLSRMEKVDFSNLIFVDGTGLLVRSNGGVKRVADLAGRKVAATRGSTGEDNLRRALPSAASRRRCSAWIRKWRA
jgi:glutamate/aspartate transport system substrate-binding protein